MLEPFDFFIVRTPLLSFKDGLDLIKRRNYSDLFKTSPDEINEVASLVHQALRLSSPEFYARCLKNFDKKKEATLIRYLLRMSTRATPFGIYAGYTIGTKGLNTELIFEAYDKWPVRSKVDGSYVLKSLQQEVSATTGVMSLNPTLWVKENELTILSRKYNEDYVTTDVNQIRFKTNQSGIEKLSALNNNRKIKTKKDSKYVDELVKHRIIVPHLDYKGYLSGHDHTSWDTFYLNDKMPSKVLETQTYIILNKSAQFCTLSEQTLNQVARGVELLHKLFECQIWVDQKKSDLGKFCESMELKYPGHELPLIEALDPAFGVMDQLDKGRPGTEPTNRDFSALERYFQNRILTQCLRMEEWALTASELKEIEALDKIHMYRSARLPSSVSAFTEMLADGKIHLKTVIGSPSTQAFSRLAAGDSSFESKLQEMSDWDKKQNENIIFAEIIDWPQDSAIANLNSRKILTEYVIPIEFPVADRPIEKQIFISDILISVCYGKIRLRSRKLDKEIVPIMSTAYNLVNQLNPFLKFLAGIASQDNFKYFGWKWGKLRELPYLPRIRYKNIILSPRAWKLSLESVKQVRLAKNKVDCFREILKLQGIPDKFYLVHNSDQRLYVDTNIDIILESFFGALFKAAEMKNFYLEEVLTEDGHEYVIPFKELIPQRQAPYPIIYQNSPNNIPSSESYLHLGSECVYLKLFTNSAGQNTLLTTDVDKFLNKLKKKNLLNYWFFIRYADPSPHLRIRLFLKNKNDWGTLIKDLNLFERNLYKSSKIWSLQLETFKRDFDGDENDKWYGFDKYSFLDSERTLNLFQRHEFQHWSEANKWLYALDMTNRYLSLAHTTLSEKLLASDKLRTAYKTMGFHASDELKMKFTKLWNDHKEVIIASIDDGAAGSAGLNTHFASLAKAFKKNCRVPKIQRIVHLSLNRTYTGVTYSEEDQIYSVLYRAYLEKAHRC
jgi:thiopeptide-type bacteriocin biosynthesis protein